MTSLSGSFEVRTMNDKQDLKQQFKDLTIHSNTIKEIQQWEHGFKMVVKPEFDLHITALNEDLDGWKIPFIESADEGLMLQFHKD